MTFTGATPRAVAVAPWLAVDDLAWAAPKHPLVLDGVGHTPMLEDPRTTGTLLHGFATKTSR